MELVLTVGAIDAELLHLLGQVGPADKANDGLFAERLERVEDLLGCGLRRGRKVIRGYRVSRVLLCRPA